MSSIQITTRSISESTAIEKHITKYFNKINRTHRNIKHCRVVTDISHKHKHKGKMFSACIDIMLPGKELVSKKQNQNLYVAIRDGFAAIEKLLEKHGKKRYFATKKYLETESLRTASEDDARAIECA